MTLINSISGDATLSPYIVPDCIDEGMCVGFHSDIDRSRTLIIKVDDYYNDQHLSDTPPSIDCLIIQFCADNHYHIYLVELKNVQSTGTIDRENLHKKFHTTLFDFMANKFRQYFFDTNYELKFHLILSAGSVSQHQIKGYSLDFLLGLPLYNFQGKRIGINGLPPRPLIQNCG